MPTLLAFAAVHLSEFTFLLFLCQITPCIYVVQCAWYRCRSLLACAWSVRAPTCIRCGNFHHKTNFLLFLFKKIYTNSKLNKIWLSFALKCRLRCLYSFTWCRIFFFSRIPSSRKVWQSWGRGLVFQFRYMAFGSLYWKIGISLGAWLYV